MKGALAMVVAMVAMAASFPQVQKEGGAYTNEAIRQAQSSQLIPKDAQIQNVSKHSLSKFWMSQSLKF